MRNATIDMQDRPWARSEETGMTYGWTTRWSWRLFAVGLPLSIVAAHIALGFLILAAVLRFRSGELRWRKTPLEKALAFYLIVCAATAAVGLVPTKAFIQLASFWHVSIYWLMVNTVSDRKELKTIVSIMLIAAALNAAYGVVQNSLDESVRAVGSFSHPMTFAGQIQMVLLLAIAVWLQLPWGRERWAMGVLLLVLSGGLVTSYTRSAWIGFLTGGSGIGWMRGIRTGLALLAVIVLFMVIAVILKPSLGQRIQSIPDIRLTGSNEERIRIWGATLEMIRDHPIFGVGGGGYRTALEAYRERWNLRSRSHAHNNFLQQAATHGLFGLAAFVAIWVVILKAAWQTARGGLPAPYQGWLVGGAMAVVAFLVAGLFEANFGDSEVAMMMWFMVGLVMWVRMRVMPPSTGRVKFEI